MSLIIAFVVQKNLMPANVNYLTRFIFYLIAIIKPSHSLVMANNTSNFQAEIILSKRHIMATYHSL